MTNSQFSWSDSAQRSFDSFKSAIAANTVLAYCDPTATLIIDTDASDIGLGAVLSQIGPDNVERPIVFALRFLSVSEKKWTVTERECLAAVWAITDQFHCYLYGTKFIVRTDNRPLSWLRSLKTLPPALRDGFSNYKNTNSI